MIHRFPHVSGFPASGEPAVQPRVSPPWISSAAEESGDQDLPSLETPQEIHIFGVPTIRGIVFFLSAVPFKVVQVSEDCRGHPREGDIGP